MRAAAFKRLLPQAQARFADHPDVTSVALGEIAGDEHDGARYAIVTFVQDLDHRRGPPIPGEITLGDVRVPIDVRHGPAEAFSLANDHVDGSDLLIVGAVGRVGTLGLVVQEATPGNRLLGLTNAHVVTVPDADAVGAPIEARVNGQRIQIGSVLYHAPYRSTSPNTVDLAVIALDAVGTQLAKAHRIQTFPNAVVMGSDGLSFSRFGGAQRPHMYGGSTLGSRDVVSVAAPAERSTITLTDQRGTRMRFGRAFLMSAAGSGVRGGHSGSVVVRKQVNGQLVVTGLLAGGRGRLAVAFSFREVLAELRRAGIALV